MPVVAAVLAPAAATAAAAAAAAAAAKPVVVGRCGECGDPHDEFSGGAVCTVCVCLVLVCGRCRERGVALPAAAAGKEEGAAAGGGGDGDDAAVPPPTSRRREWFCEEHEKLRGSLFTFLDSFGVPELQRQLAALARLEGELGGTAADDDPRQRRSTLRKQVRRVQARIKAVQGGVALDGRARCRSCKKCGCKGDCWGFWKKDGGGKTPPAKRQNQR